MKDKQWAVFEAMLGFMRAEWKGDNLILLKFVKGENLKETGEQNHPVIIQLKRELNEYFSRQRQEFELSIQPDGSDFQKKVWNYLSEIPYGRAISYSDLARQIGGKDLVRAVAKANADNPILILVPCHRVIGKDGELTGYAGGLKRKERLLQLEGFISEQKELF